MLLSAAAFGNSQAAAPALLPFGSNCKDCDGTSGYRRADPCLESTRDTPSKVFCRGIRGNGIVINAVQAVPDPGNGSFVIGAFPGQHSMVTAPPVTDPLPVMRNVENLGSKKNWVNPTPVLATF
jgi:hypothetical protein